MAKKEIFVRNERVKPSVKSQNGFFNPGVSDNIIQPKSENNIEQISTLSTLSSNVLKTSLTKDFESNEEVKEFLDQHDFECNEIDTKTSTKSNFYILNNNWLNLVKYLKNLKASIKWLWDHIQIESLVNAVLEKLEKQKNLVTIPNTLIYDSENPVIITYVDQNTNKTYTIQRESLHCVSIKREPDWDTSNLIVCVKDANYTNVNVSITTSNNEIRIDFMDGEISPTNLQSTYYVYFI